MSCPYLVLTQIFVNSAGAWSSSAAESCRAMWREDAGNPAGGENAKIPCGLLLGYSLAIALL